jgi:hypothetical protein
MYQLFRTQADLSGGIKGEVDSYGLGVIWVEVHTDIINASGDFPNVLLYKITADALEGTLRPDSYNGLPDIISNTGLLGDIGKKYPDPWTTDNITSSSLIAKEYYCNQELPGQVFMDLMGSTIPVKIRVFSSGGTFLAAKIPGIGEFTAKDASNLKFDPMHSCNGGNAVPTIREQWTKIKTLPGNLTDASVDLYYAAHRGFWGDNLGAGPVENTDPSIQAALPYTKIIESDITKTRDGVLVVSHDYNLQRLTDYDGPAANNTFIYNLNYAGIKDLKLRKRNFEVTDNQFIQLKDLISYMVKYKTVLTIDVKERATRRNPVTGEKTAACDVTREVRDQGWVEIFGKIIDLAREMEAEGVDVWQYIAVKTPLKVNRIKQLLPQEKYADMARILYFPVIQPGGSVDDAVVFINDWYNNAPNYLMGFETNFKTDRDPIVRSFEKGGTVYANILDYVVKNTHVRPGLYPEEPMGPKGIVDRYAQWLFKNLNTDYRRDPYFLMTIPYFPVSILTTDRPDIWQNIQRLYQ